MLYNIRYFFFRNFLSIYFSFVTSTFFLKGPSDIIRIRMPSFYFFKNEINSLMFLFLDKYFTYSFYKHVLYLYKRLYKYNFVKLRLKGLGFKIRKITFNLYRFYFDYINFFYFHIPSNFIISTRRKRLLLVSLDYSLLKTVLSQLLLLKKISVYRIRGLVYPRQIIFLKIGKKTL